MSETAPAAGHVLGYALNAFPYHTLAELWPVLENDVLQIKERMYLHSVFPIELRFSEPIVRELQQDWNTQGPEAFSFDTLDRLEPSGDDGRVTPEDLQMLLQMWRDRLKAAGEQIYGRP